MITAFDRLEVESIATRSPSEDRSASRELTGKPYDLPLEIDQKMPDSTSWAETPPIPTVDREFTQAFGAGLLSGSPLDPRGVSPFSE